MNGDSTMNGFRVLTLCVAFFIPSVVWAGAPAEGSAVKVMKVKELSSLLTKKDAVTVCDANGEKTRNEYGVIPGAKLLSSYREFDIAKELPTDKNSKLVFYCSSTRCSAAPKAAERAVEAGYADVNVLKVGIKGWIEAGKKVAKLGG